MGSGFGGTGFLWWKCSMMCFLIGPHKVAYAHSGDASAFVLAPATTPKVVPSDTGTIFDGSWPEHGALEAALWSCATQSALWRSAATGTLKAPVPSRAPTALLSYSPLTFLHLIAT